MKRVGQAGKSLKERQALESLERKDGEPDLREGCTKVPLISPGANTLWGLWEHRRRTRTGKRDKVKEMMMGGFESSRPIFDFAAAGIFAFFAVLEHWAFLFLEMPRERHSNYFKTQENFLGGFQFALQFFLSLPSETALMKSNRSWR